MKKLLLLSLFLLMIFQISSAQVDPKFNHYMFNELVYNPAAAGSREKISTLLLYRTQWDALPGAPKTLNFSIHAPVKFLKGALGLHMTDDRIAFGEKNTGVYLSYAYRRAFMKGNLSFGLSGGIIQRQLDGSKFEPSQAGDRFIPTGILNSMTLDMNAGAYYYDEQLNLGISMTRINRPTISDGASSAEIPLNRHLYTFAGYWIPINDDFKVQPSTLIKTDLAAIQFDLTGLLYYKNKFWLGLGYTSQDAVVGLVGANVTERISLGYSREFTTSQLRKFSNGSNEIFVRYDFNINLQKKPPIIIRSPRFL